MRIMEKKADHEAIEAHITDILTRGVGTFVDPEGTLKKKLIAKAKGEYKKNIVIKFGVDPTRPDIHLGHAVVLHKLRQLQELGCIVVFLFGDFTAQIGDPTGKSKARPEVDQAAIEANMKTYLDQVGKILDLHAARFSWIRNSDWFYTVTDYFFDPKTQLNWNTKDSEGVERNIPIDPNSFVGKALLFDRSRMQTQVLKKPARGVTFMTILSVLRHVTLAQLIERDMFQKRISDGEPLFMHEMLYPILQGIDSNVLSDVYDSCDLEVGGTDQTFNMLMGRTVMEMTKKEPQAVLSFALLVGLDGKEKMSKSLDNYVGITDAPSDMFGKLMSIPDSAIESYYELCTFTPMDDVVAIRKKIETGKVNPRDSKMELAQQIVEIYHGRAKAEEAKAAFVSVFQEKKLPDTMPEVSVAKGTLLVDVLLENDIVDSKTEFRRLLSEGAIRKDGEEKLSDPAMIVEENLTLKVGKHRFIRIIASEDLCK
jgi:tyrosyl-tRNA synthetase